MTSIEQAMQSMGVRARAAFNAVRTTPAAARTAALYAMADAVERGADAILAANAQDLARAGREGMTEAMLDRLALTPARVADMAASLREIAGQPDPVGVEDERWTPPSGLDIARVRVPIGVLAVIYESRPNVTADAAALCVRSGNALILRTGSAALVSAVAIHAALAEGLSEAGLPGDLVQLVSTPDRAAVGAILTGLDGTIDLIVPRGGRSLVQRVQSEARAPVLGHLEGLCHTYLHVAADPEKARRIVLNAKMRRVTVCGATETLLVDASVADTLLPAVAADLLAAGCLLRGDARTCAIVPAATPAVEADWTTEYLAPTLAVRVVDGMAEALDHIARYGSGHTDAIVTEDPAAAAEFLDRVDSAIVMHNASTQFADGGQFGFGGEIGIATGRLHARGPVGAAQLTTYKYLVRAQGAVRP
ncbi:MAG: glutamate-5-semialdehyde dehydrogenase [Alphaproteobacteria bacterium]|uniref:glutamate-5-semialdehyde dehydrogenase n=1 Tax=Brevundimonas sp. TaxID=1871086 RepID=UPI0017E67438|nr:glutamate-5-semialdehyde dehydrogenase [Brevundimonas sp.]MBU3969566.1 glutamate-5-semialdehyde dehydrogenase [Alphaproteobacteria bacterium]MBA3050495.1 glutamate-5-semialdehyde dehydrogenase [Brevundimonas sp.]MBU3972509.1 glutamate-5-semialdehyde dehydrogenase [Alphaproteobacteria bacterium]MBU4038697.1 glutamate-5-semialdehyde dehydrogenase [Alphaproteobacteria bacterium]MBU4136383.1 glutamate-5-semialdehyde dehydrogenase [Alphaproteobacteria bacterium]